MVDKLAKAAKFSPCPRFWLDDIPSDVQSLVFVDKSFVLFLFLFCFFCFLFFVFCFLFFLFFEKEVYLFYLT